MSELKDRQLYLIDAYCSGNLTDEEFKELEDQLRESQELRRMLAEYRSLETLLRATARSNVSRLRYSASIRRSS